MVDIHDCPNYHMVQFVSSINDIYYAALDDPTEGLNAITFQQLVTHICTTYAQIS